MLSLFSLKSVCGGGGVKRALTQVTVNHTSMCTLSFLFFRFCNIPRRLNPVVQTPLVGSFRY